MSRMLAGLCATTVLTTSAAAEPGRLLAVSPSANPPEGARAWRIRYETVDHLGRQTQSTGIVFAPRAPAKARPVVAWNHGTIGIVESCSPSRDPKISAQIPALDAMLARGWVVVATDYPGLGTKGPHGYLVGRAAAAAVLDGLRAARQLPGAAAGRSIALWGHSQGGHASLWAGLRAGDYAPDFRLRSVVAASPPTDLAEVLDRLDPTAKGILTGYVLQSWSMTYGLPLTQVTDARTAGIIGRATRGCLGGKTGLDQLVRIVALKGRLANLNLRAQPRWSALLQQNSVAAAPPAPLLLVSSDADKIVNDAVTRAFARRAEASGARVTLLPLPGRDHAVTAEESAQEAVAFIARHFGSAD
jgi:acetyl esterase/lipase